MTYITSIKSSRRAGLGSDVKMIDSWLVWGVFDDLLENLQTWIGRLGGARTKNNNHNTRPWDQTSKNHQNSILWWRISHQSNPLDELDSDPMSKWLIHGLFDSCSRFTWKFACGLGLGGHKTIMYVGHKSNLWWRRSHQSRSVFRAGSESDVRFG